MTTESDERGRIRAILDSTEGKRMPTLASTIAFHSDLSPEAAAALFVAASADAAAAPTRTIAEPIDVSAHPELIRPRSGFAGLGAPDQVGGGASPSAGWSRAVRSSNGPADHEPKPAKAGLRGWARATSFLKPVTA